MKEDDPLADYVGPRARRLSRQAYRAVRRLSPEGRAALSGIPLRREDLSAARRSWPLSLTPTGGSALSQKATLSKVGALPDGYRPSFVGRLRSPEFLEVVSAEDPSAIERDAR